MHLIWLSIATCTALVQAASTNGTRTNLPAAPACADLCATSWHPGWDQLPLCKNYDPFGMRACVREKCTTPENFALGANWLAQICPSLFGLGCSPQDPCPADLVGAAPLPTATDDEGATDEPPRSSIRSRAKSAASSTASRSLSLPDDEGETDFGGSSTSVLPWSIRPTGTDSETESSSSMTRSSTSSRSSSSSSDARRLVPATLLLTLLAGAFFL